MNFHRTGCADPCWSLRLWSSSEALPSCLLFAFISHRSWGARMPEKSESIQNVYSHYKCVCVCSIKVRFPSFFFFSFLLELKEAYQLYVHAVLPSISPVCWQGKINLTLKDLTTHTHTVQLWSVYSWRTWLSPWNAQFSDITLHKHVIGTKFPKRNMLNYLMQLSPHSPCWSRHLQTSWTWGWTAGR